MRADVQGPAARGSSMWTVLAIGAVVYVLAKVLHEAVGHGLFCVLGGGDWRGVSSSWSVCETSAMSGGSLRAMKAAGTLANLLGGALALGWLRTRTPARASSRYALWFFAAVNLFMGAGYLMVDPFFRFGDWDEFVEGLPGERAWRLGLTVLGIGLTLGTFFLLRRPLESLLPLEPRLRSRRARLLCWLPYVAAGGVLMTVAALRNVLGLHYAFTSSLATVGGTSLLIWLPLSMGAPDAQAMELERLELAPSRAWCVAGLLAALFVLLLFGPGIPIPGAA